MSIRVVPLFNGTFDRELVGLHGACLVSYRSMHIYCFIKGQTHLACEEVLT